MDEHHEPDPVDLRHVLAELDGFRDRFVRQLDEIQARLNAVIAEQTAEAKAVNS